MRRTLTGAGAAVLLGGAMFLVRLLGQGAVITPPGAPPGAAPGAPTNCVHVDGGSGPCPNFAYAESPVAVVPYSVYTLAHAPAPPESLQIFVSGLLQAPATGNYTLAGNTITFTGANFGSLLVASPLVAYYQY